MYSSLLATTVAGVMLVGGALSASAAESTIEMQLIEAKGPGPAIGQVHLTDDQEGVVMQIDLSDLPPGPNRIFLHDVGDCAVPRGERLSNPLAVVDVGINEDGAEPLKKTVTVPGKRLADMQHKALVIYRGSQAADLVPEQVAAPRYVACGVIQ